VNAHTNHTTNTTPPPRDDVYLKPIGEISSRKKMTLKPAAEMREEATNNSNCDVDNEAITNTSNIPETNDDDNSQQENNSPNNRKQFYVGQQLDILDSVQYWTEAEVVKYDEVNKKIFVTFLFWTSKWDDWVDISPDKVAPLHTHTYNPPNPLKLRQRIEVFGLSEWREAFVVDENESHVRQRHHHPILLSHLCSPYLIGESSLSQCFIPI
jgi:hypothetical protein